MQFFFGKRSVEKEKAIFLKQMASFKLEEQVESQFSILLKTGLLETAPDGKVYITGVDGKQYPTPTIEEIVQRLDSKRDLVNQKIEQGFTKLIIVPFACPLETILKKYGDSLISHYRGGKFFTTKEDDSILNLELDLENPVNAWEDSKCGDTKDTLVYYPGKYDRIYHKGKTKKELLADAKNAWQIILMEDMLDIPATGKGKKIGHRRQIEAGETPTKYLNLLKNEKNYLGEEGLTPETDLIYCLTRLEENNLVINDWQGNGNVSYELGSLLVSSDSIPWLAWNRDFKRADLWKFNFEYKDSHTGARSCLRF